MARRRNSSAQQRAALLHVVLDVCNEAASETVVCAPQTTSPQHAAHVAAPQTTRPQHAVDAACRQEIRDQVDELPEMKKLRVDPSQCDPDKHTDETSIEKLREEVPEGSEEGQEEASAGTMRHMVSDSFHSLQTGDSPHEPSSEDTMHPDTASRSLKRQLSRIRAPSSFEVCSEHPTASSLPHHSSAPVQDNTAKEWEDVFG